MKLSYTFLLLSLSTFACTDSARLQPPDTGGDSDADTDTDTDAHSDSDTATDTDTGGLNPACSIQQTAPLSSLTCATSAPCIWTPATQGSRYGSSVDGQGDLNGDGFPDIVVSAPLEDYTDGTNGLVDSGSVRIYSGATTHETNRPVVTLMGAANGDYFGEKLSYANDTNGDGRSDFLVGIRRASNLLKNAGRVELFLGTDDWSDLTGSAVSILGTVEFSEFGTRVSGLGDVNGDGLADFAIADELKSSKTDQNRYYRGGVRIFLGRDTWESTLTNGDADLSLVGHNETGGSGLGLTSGGDFDGDGYIDMAIGTPYDGPGRVGTVHTIRGASELSTTTSLLNESAERELTGTASSSACGWSLSVGDWNQDGFSDLAIGCPLGDSAGINSGEIRIFHGNEAFFLEDEPPDTLISGAFDRFEFGTHLSNVGDANGDTIDDLAVGSIKTYRGFAAQSGKVHLFYGSTEGWGTTRSASTSEVGIHGDRTKDYLGATVGGTDLNQDGLTDLLFSTASGEHVYLFWGTAD